MKKNTAKKEVSEYVEFFGPLLNALRELGGSGGPIEVADKIAELLEIPEKKLNETLKSGQLKFRNYVRWDRQYLIWEGLVDSSQRGIWSLTEKGLSKSLTRKEALQIFLKWTKRKKNKAEGSLSQAAMHAEIEEYDYKEKLRKTLLEILHSLSPKGFERFSQRLLRESGFTKVEVTGRTVDGGIDGYGTLQINNLLSFKVMFQCKRYKDSVGPKEMRDFQGALLGRCDKAIFITTGTFTIGAQKEAMRDGGFPIELVDGEKLLDTIETLVNRKIELTPFVI